MPTPEAAKAEEAQVRRVGLGAELDPAHVAHAHQRAVGAGLHHDVLELIRLGEAAGGADADGEELVASAGASPTAPAAAWTFCSRKRGHDVAGRDLARGELRGSSHSRIALALAEDQHTLPTPGTRFMRVAHVDVEVVADEGRAVAVVLRVERPRP